LKKIRLEMDNQAPAPVQVISQAPAPAVDTVALAAAPAVVAETSPSPIAQPAPVVQEAAPTPVVVETPAPVETAPSEASKPAETILGEAPKPAQEAVTNQEGGQSVEPAPPPSEEVVQETVLPTYDPFTLPEGVSLQDDRVKEFHSLLAGLETEGKLPHDLAQQFGQKAVDFHINEVKRVAEDLTTLYQTTWEKQKTSWKDEFLADPVLGGNRFQTTVDAANDFIRTHGGTAEEQAEFRQLMESSGLGNHKVMIRILASAASNLQEAQPLAATKPVSAPKSKTQTLYGKS
jgi:hypothetical protein